MCPVRARYEFTAIVSSCTGRVSLSTAIVTIRALVVRRRFLVLPGTRFRASFGDFVDRTRRGILGTAIESRLSALTENATLRRSQTTAERTEIETGRAKA